MPKISVIVPVYNTEKYLVQCLESLINQTFSDIEIICVDDGSKDNSLKILEEYSQKDERIKVFSQENQGAGAARNFGMEKACGEFLYFMDSDDYLKLDAFEKVYNQITKYNADICILNFTNFEYENNKIESWFNIKENNFKGLKCFSSYDFAESIFQCSHFPAFTKLYKKQFIIEKNIRFQNIKCCNDLYFHMISLAMASKITYLNEILYFHLVNIKECITFSRGNNSECCLLALNAVRDFLKQKKLLQIFEKSFYFTCAQVFNYEYLCSNNKDKYFKKYKNFFPLKYLHIFEKEFAKKNITFWQQFFSVKNEGKHKVLRVLGIKIKFKRKTK